MASPPKVMERSNVCVSDGGGTVSMLHYIETLLAERMERYQARFDDQEKLMSQRMDAIEKAVEVAHENIVRFPTDVDKAVNHLNAVIGERFHKIDVQILERDIRLDQTSRDSKVALDAALQSAEKMVAQQTLSSSQAITKSEIATQKQIDQQSLAMISATSALGDKIDDIKDRLTRIEGEGRGLKAAETTQQTSNMSVVSIIGLVVGSLIGITGIIVAIISYNRAP